MALFGSIASECKHRNRIARNVKEHYTAFDPGSYWKQAVGQNFLITGGEAASRIAILEETIRCFRAFFPGPVIILNGSEDLEARLIALANSNQLGKLAVSSQRYRNYDLFDGLTGDVIRRLFEKAPLGQTETVKLSDYTEAFLAILQCKYAPSFHSMFALARQTDKQIADFGAACRVRPEYLDRIRDGVSAGLFRRVLTDYGKAFLNIQGNTKTGITISNIGNSNTTHVIWANSDNQRLTNEVLAQELKILRETKRIPFLLVVNDINLTPDDPLLDVIQSAKLANRFGLCCNDVVPYAVAAGERAQPLLMNHFPSLLVLNSGAEDYADQEQILGKFGKYMHYEPTEEITTQPGIIQLPGSGSRHIGMVNYERLRVTVEDMEHFAIAVLGDARNQVNLYRSLNI